MFLAILSTTLLQTIIASKFVNTTSSRSNSKNVTANVVEQTVSSDDDKSNCISNSQLEVIEYVTIRLAAIELHNMEFQAAFDILEKNHLLNKPPIKLLIDYVLRSCFNNSFEKLLKFVNFTSDVNWKIIGYRMLFNEIASNSSLSKYTELWLKLQYIVSQDATVPELQNLSKEIELKFNNVLDSPNYKYVDHFEYPDVCNYRSYIPFYFPQSNHLQYLIHRICAADSLNIKRANDFLFGKYYYISSTMDSTELILACVVELERNSKLNYTLGMIPYISRELQRQADQKQCQIRNQLIDKFPTKSSVRKLLSQTHEFYIRNAYNNEYLYQIEKDVRVFTNSTKKSIWRIKPYFTKLKISNKLDKVFSSRKCPIHEEYYFIVGDAEDADGADEGDDDSAMWSLETEDIFSSKYRIRKKGEYLSVGERNNIVLSSEYKNIQSSKLEWIFESLPNQVDNIKGENERMCSNVDSNVKSNNKDYSEYSDEQ